MKQRAAADSPVPAGVRPMTTAHGNGPAFDTAEASLPSRPGKLMPLPPDPTGPDTRTRGTLTSWAQAPLVAVQFLTVFPPLVRRPLTPSDLGRSESFFPLTGLLLGAVLAGADVVSGPWVVQPVRDVLLVALLAILTGALHLDGVIDTADGIFASGGKERRLEIMRDPRAGAFGVVGVVLLLALKVAALGSLPQASRVPALLLAPMLGRWAIVLVTQRFPYARPEGMGRSFKNAVRWSHVLIAGLIAAVAAWAVIGPVGLIVAGGSSLLALVVARWMAGRLDGLTGDAYGAICELTETGVLVALGLRMGSIGG